MAVVMDDTFVRPHPQTMSRDTRNAGLSILLALALTVTASVSARVYKEHRDTLVAQAAEQIACR